jgi:hypothetical protein
VRKKLLRNFLKSSPTPSLLPLFKNGALFPLAPCRRPTLSQPVRLRGFAPYAPYGRSSRKPHSGSRLTAAGGSYSHPLPLYYPKSKRGIFSHFATVYPPRKMSQTTATIKKMPWGTHFIIPAQIWYYRHAGLNPAATKKRHYIYPPPSPRGYPPWV